MPRCPLMFAIFLTLVAGCDGATTTPTFDQAPGDSAIDAPGGRAPDQVPASEEPASDPEPEPVDAPEPVDEPEVPLLEAVLALEGASVVPQTLLHLDSGPADCDGQAAQFEWSVTQPAGSRSLLLPNAHHASPTFEANVAGDYTFELRSFGPDGQLCTTPHAFLLSVTPDTLLHVELLWHTALDPDESDEGPEAGSDLDLHFQRVLDGDISGGWFGHPFDCFWFNANPNWGSLDPEIDDDPSLDRDDTDGAGPENLNLDALEAGATYAVMAQYWNDHGFGTSAATVRVYLMGELVYESDGVEMVQGDAWEVGVLHDDLTFVPSASAEGGPAIEADFYGEFMQSP